MKGEQKKNSFDTNSYSESHVPCMSSYDGQYASGDNLIDLFSAINCISSYIVTVIWVWIPFGSKYIIKISSEKCCYERYCEWKQVEKKVVHVKVQSPRGTQAMIKCQIVMSLHKTWLDVQYIIDYTLASMCNSPLCPVFKPVFKIQIIVAIQLSGKSSKFTVKLKSSFYIWLNRKDQKISELGKIDTHFVITPVWKPEAYSNQISMSVRPTSIFCLRRRTRKPLNISCWNMLYRAAYWWSEASDCFLSRTLKPWIFLDETCHTDQASGEVVPFDNFKFLFSYFLFCFHDDKVDLFQKTGLCSFPRQNSKTVEYYLWWNLQYRSV